MDLYKEYIEICDFKFKNKKYVLYIDDEKKYFFMRKKGKELSYITIEELILLTNFIGYNKDVMLVNDNNNNMYSFKSTNGSIPNNNNSNYNTMNGFNNTGGNIPNNNNNIPIGYNMYNRGNVPPSNGNNPNFYNGNPTPYANINKRPKKKRIVPKIIIGGVAFILTSSSLFVVGNAIKNRYYRPASSYSDTVSSLSPNYDATTPSEHTTETKNNDKTTEAINKYYDNVRSDKENFEVETYRQLWKTYSLYDSSVYDQFFGYPASDVTFDLIRQTIRNNSNISDKFKNMYLELIDNVEKKYPSIDLRVLYENLKTLEIKEVPEIDMKIKAISSTAYACYRLDENVIYTVEGYDYKKGTWEYQVIIHEMCHPFRSGRIDLDGYGECRIQFENSSGHGSIIGESLNSLFSLRSYDEKEMDIAYQLQSNMLETIVNSLPNEIYTYQDFINHNITYFENALNEYNKNDLAVDMISLMELQYKDYHDDDVLVEQSMYHHLYDYIADMYYMKNIDSNMSYEEACAVRDQLIYKITYDVPDDYNIDVNHFKDYFEEYCKKNGINEKSR